MFGWGGGEEGRGGQLGVLFPLCTYVQENASVPRLLAMIVAEMLMVLANHIPETSQPVVQYNGKYTHALEQTIQFCLR